MRRHQSLVDECPENVQRRPGNRFGGRDRRPAGEYAEREKCRALLVVEQFVAPIERRSQRPLAFWSVAWAGPEHRERIVEPRREVLEAEHADPRGRQFDRQR